MNLKRKLTGTLLLQVFGSLASFLASVIVARYYGPTGQGYLSYLRSISDLLVAIGLFGFPQAFVYMLNTGAITETWGVWFSFRYTLVFGIILLAVTAIFHTIGLTTSNGLNLLITVAVYLATVAALLHGLFRAIILAVKSNFTFNVITILPLVSLFFIYLVWHPAEHKILILAYMAAQLIASIAALLLLWNVFSLHSPAEHQQNYRWIKQASQYGIWSFLATISANFVSAGAFSVMRQGGITDTMVGYFSVSLLFVSAALLPLNMVIPVLFDAWSKEKELKSVQPSYLKLSHLGVLLTILVVVGGVILVKLGIELAFGKSYLPSVLPTQIILLSIYAVYQSRLLSAILLSIGRPQIVALGSGVKLITLLIIYLGWAHSLEGVAWAWNVGEFASMGLMTLVVQRHTGWSLLQISGLSPSWVSENLKMIFANYGKVQV